MYSTHLIQCYVTDIVKTTRKKNNILYFNFNKSGGNKALHWQPGYSEVLSPPVIRTVTSMKSKVQYPFNWHTWEGQNKLIYLIYIILPIHDKVVDQYTKNQSSGSSLFDIIWHLIFFLYLACRFFYISLYQQYRGIKYYCT